VDVKLDGPGELKGTTTDHGDGTYTIEYTPTVAGDCYRIHITANGHILAGCPYMATVDPGVVEGAKCTAGGAPVEMCCGHPCHTDTHCT